MIPGTRVLPGLVSDMLFSWNLLEPWDLKQGIIGNQVKASLIEKACLDYCEDYGNTGCGVFKRGVQN